MKPRTPELFAGSDPRTGFVTVAVYNAVQLGQALVAMLTLDEARNFRYALDKEIVAVEQLIETRAARDSRAMPTTPDPTGIVVVAPKPLCLCGHAWLEHRGADGNCDCCDCPIYAPRDDTHGE